MLHIYIYIYICMYICIHTHTSTCVYIYIYIYTCADSFLSSVPRSGRRLAGGEARAQLLRGLAVC